VSCTYCRRFHRPALLLLLLLLLACQPLLLQRCSPAEVWCFSLASALRLLLQRRQRCWHQPAEETCPWPHPRQLQQLCKYHHDLCHQRRLLLLPLLPLDRQEMLLLMLEELLAGAAAAAA
jgi:hypothetical protein